MLGLPWSDPPWLDMGVLALAVALDLALGDPPNAVHPVAWMGKAAGPLERWGRGRGPAAAFLMGVVLALALPGAFGLATYLAIMGLKLVGPAAYLIGGTVLLKTTFAVRGLARAARKVGAALERGEAAQAQQDLRALVSRDVRGLPRPLLASAAVESVAENTADSFLAPWLAFVLLGIPGAVAYRAVNTLDAMVGYHGRYEHLGKASARLDDLLNGAPARLAGALTVLAALLLGYPARRAWRILWREKGKTESPNAGWSMSAMAGVLGVRLEKVGHYQLGSELPEPGPEHVRQAVQVMGAVAGLGLALCLGLLGLRWWAAF